MDSGRRVVGPSVASNAVFVGSRVGGITMVRVGSAVGAAVARVVGSAVGDESDESIVGFSGVAGASEGLGATFFLVVGSSSVATVGCCCVVGGAVGFSWKIDGCSFLTRVGTLVTSCSRRTVETASPRSSDATTARQARRSSKPCCLLMGW